MAYDPTTDAVRKNDKTAEGAIPFKGDRPPSDGPNSKYDGVYRGDVSAGADCTDEFKAAAPDTQKPDAHEQPAHADGHLFGPGRPD